MKDRIAPAQIRRGEMIDRAAARLGLILRNAPEAMPAGKKKAAWFPRRPFLSYGSHTLAGDFRTSAPGAYLPAVS